MKKWIIIICLLLAGCGAETVIPEETSLPVPETRAAATVPQPPEEAAEETTGETIVETTEETLPEPVCHFTEEETDLLLKIGMAERGDTGCVDCIALVMRTVLNRAEGPKFSSTIKGVIYAEDQFTPVAEGTFESAQPNEACYEALDKILYGWDESQGALYYEWCEGESWHSQNLNLLLQHCDTRFYN